MNSTSVGYLPIIWALIGFAIASSLFLSGIAYVLARWFSRFALANAVNALGAFLMIIVIFALALYPPLMSGGTGTTVAAMVMIFALSTPMYYVAWKSGEFETRLKATKKPQRVIWDGN